MRYLNKKLRRWKSYDPEWLAKLAEEQCPEMPWLPGALRNCRRGWWESRAYVYFAGSDRPNREDSAWRFERNAMLTDKKEGDLVLDILEGQRVGGVEFLKRL